MPGRKDQNLSWDLSGCYFKWLSLQTKVDLPLWLECCCFSHVSALKGWLGASQHQGWKGGTLGSWSSSALAGVLLHVGSRKQLCSPDSCRVRLTQCFCLVLLWCKFSSFPRRSPKRFLSLQVFGSLQSAVTMFLAAQQFVYQELA